MKSSSKPLFVFIGIVAITSQFIKDVIVYECTVVPGKRNKDVYEQSCAVQIESCQN